jgi:hypothetical protein
VLWGEMLLRFLQAVRGEQELDMAVRDESLGNNTRSLHELADWKCSWVVDVVAAAAAEHDELDGLGEDVTGTNPCNLPPVWRTTACCCKMGTMLLDRTLYEDDADQTLVWKIQIQQNQSRMHYDDNNSGQKFSLFGSRRSSSSKHCKRRAKKREDDREVTRATLFCTGS